MGENFTDKLPVSREILDKVRSRCGQNTDETAETTNLHLSRDEFMQKMLQEENGEQLLDLLESGEWRICERHGLSNAYISDGVAYIDVPRWNNLVSHLKIVNEI
jgi:hypothetical protein